MALPVILVDSATGSDSLASGAGPSTALTGSSGVSASDGLTIDLSGDSPNLSGVATDGSAVIYFADATSGNRNFAKITAANNSTKVVTVSNAVGTSLTKSWAIGGKRESLSSTTSRKLFDNNSGNGDAMPGWTIEMQSGHIETWPSSFSLSTYRQGDTTSGRITLRGIAGAAVRPRIEVTSTTSSTNHVIAFEGYWTVQSFNMVRVGGSNGFVTAIGVGTTGSPTNTSFIDVKILGTAAINWYAGIKFYSNTYSCDIRNCEFTYINVEGGVNFQGSVTIEGCRFSNLDGSSIAFNGYNGGTVIRNNIIMAGGPSSIGISRSTDYGFDIHIEGNTIDGMSSDAIYLNSVGSLAIISNNLFTNNGGYGIHINSTAIPIKSICVIRNNVFYNNVNKYSPSDIGSLDEQTLDPMYANPVAGDFTPTNPALVGTGFPSSIP